MSFKKIAAALSALLAVTTVHGAPAEVEALKPVENQTLLAFADSVQPTPHPIQGVLPDDYELATTYGKVSVAVRRNWENGFASVQLNQREVMKFRSDLVEGSVTKDPLTRAREAAQSLVAYLQSGGQAEALKVSEKDGFAVITARGQMIAVADAETAKLAQTGSVQRLATLWVNFIRQSLGVSPLETIQKVAFRATGLASWYGPGFHGRRAADGSVFNQNALTAAHRSLPFGTLVRVLNPKNGKSCIVKITDRGPFIHGRMMDLSKQAAATLGILSSGVGTIQMEVLAR